MKSSRSTRPSARAPLRALHPILKTRPAPFGGETHSLQNNLGQIEIFKFLTGGLNNAKIRTNFALVRSVVVGLPGVRPKHHNVSQKSSCLQRKHGNPLLRGV